MNVETAIQARTRQWLAAAANNDLEAVMALYHPSIRSFDAILKMQVQGAADYREHWQACMNTCPGEAFFKMHDLHISHSGELAVATSLVYCGAKQDGQEQDGQEQDGQEQGGWMRGTQVWQRDDDQWLIIHEHFSCPFDPQDMALIMSWQPDQPPVLFNQGA